MFRKHDYRLKKQIDTKYDNYKQLSTCNHVSKTLAKLCKQASTYAVENKPKSKKELLYY